MKTRKFSLTIVLGVVTSAVILTACSSSGSAPEETSDGENFVAATVIPTAATPMPGVSSQPDQAEPSGGDDSQASVPPTVDGGGSVSSSDGVEVFTMEGQLAEDFQSLSAIASASTAVVVGTVVEAKPNPYQNIPFTVSTVRIDEAVRGDVKAGDTITVVETGGLIAGRSKLEPGEYGKAAEAAFEGVRVMAVGEQWLLFLGPYDPGPVATNAFSVKGVFQGKMRVEGDGKLNFTGSSESLDSPIFALPLQLDGRAVREVLDEVRGLGE